MTSRRSGFTIAEVLLVIAIISLLLIAVLLKIQSQIARAQDSKRKADLYLLRNTFEEYHNDNETYPPEGSIDDCGGPAMQPYLDTVPCDPFRKSPYGYFLSSETSGFRVCAILADTTDPAIADAGCDGPELCGVGGGFNFCLATGTTGSAVGTGDQIFGGGPTPTPTPTPGAPTPTPGGSQWACTPPDVFGISHCNLYVDPLWQSCPVSYGADNTCRNECSNPAVRCPF